MYPRRVPAALLGLAAGACSAVHAPPAVQASVPAADDAAGWRAAAQRDAGADLRPAFAQFCRTGAGPNLDAVEIPPLRAFDNLVFLGRGKWNSWALLTSGGIILFDALETEAEVERYVIGGLAALGLDPSTIRHVVVMHGHGDHFGGARLLQQRYGARVWLSEADGELMRSAEARGELRPGSTVPRQDGTIRDGDTLTVGDATVRFYLTPGHTPGTLSALLPLRDGGTGHVGGYWGGTGFAAGRADFPAYFDSLARFRRIAAEAGADVALSNHPNNDMTLSRLPLLNPRVAGTPHPLVLGRDGYQRFLSVLEACVHAARAAADPELRRRVRP